MKACLVKKLIWGLLLVLVMPALLQAITIRDAHLILEADPRGFFMLRKAADGAWLTYPKYTGYFSVQVDEEIYAMPFRSVTVTSATEAIADNALSTTYQLSDEIEIVQLLTLGGGNLEIKYIVHNNETSAHHIRVRTLLDTQIDVNDGSPLYSPSAGLKIDEVVFAPGITSWKSYNDWPNYRVQSECTYQSFPYQVIFAFWPSAVNNPWDYETQPGRRFFTPGKTRSGEGSDSCVLSYFDLGLMPAGSRAEVVYYYGSEPAAVESGLAGIQAALQRLERAWKEKIDADLRLLALCQARSYKMLFTSGLITAGAGEGGGARKEITGLVEKALGAMADQLLPGKQELFLAPASPFSLRTRLITDGVDRGYALQVCSMLMNSCYQAGCNPGESEQLLAERIFRILRADPRFASENQLSRINTLFQKVYQTIKTGREVADSEVIIRNINRVCTDLQKSRFNECTVRWPSLQDSCITFDPAGMLGSFEQLSRYAATLDSAGENVRLAAYAAAGGRLNRSVLALVAPGSACMAKIVTGGAQGAPLREVVNQTCDRPELAARSIIGLNGLWSLICYCNAELPVFLKVTNGTLNYAAWVLGGGSAGHRSDLAVREFAMQNCLIDAITTLANAEGQISLENRRAERSIVNLYLEISGPPLLNLEPVSISLPGPMKLAAAESRRLPLAARLPSMLLWGRCDHYSAKLWVADGFDLAYVLTAEFTVGPQNLVAVLQRSSRAVLMEGTINEGQVREARYTVADSVDRVVIRQVDEGDNVDLHVYNGAGEHVGLNYATGLVDQQIAGIRYSGPAAVNEWMELEGQSGKTFRVAAVGVDLPGAKPLQVTATPVPEAIVALMAASCSPVRPLRDRSGAYAGLIQIMEVGGKSGVRDLNYQLIREKSTCVPRTLKITRRETELAAGGKAAALLLIEDIPCGEPGRLMLRARGTDARSGQLLSADFAVAIPAAAGSSGVWIFLLILLVVLLVAGGIVLLWLQLGKSAGRRASRPETEPRRQPARREVNTDIPPTEPEAAGPSCLLLGDKKFTLREGIVGIGRSQTNDIVIQLKKASGQHARIFYQHGRYYISDLDSLNGTLVNGKQITTTVLTNGDVIEIAGVILKFHSKA